MMIGGDISPIIMGAGETILAGTPITFKSAVTNHHAVAALDDTNAIAVYSLASGAMEAQLITRAGLVLTASGSPVSVTAYGIYTDIVALDSTHAVVISYNNATTYLRCIPIELSGGSLVVGTAVESGVGASYYYKIEKLTDTKAVVVFPLSSNGQLRGMILNRSGNTLTAGAVYTLNTAISNGYEVNIAVFSPTSIAAIYTEYSANYLRCVPATISGDAITPGTITTLVSQSTLRCAVAGIGETRAIMCYPDTASSSRGTAAILTLASGSVTKGTSIVFDAGPYVGIRSAVKRRAPGETYPCIVMYNGTSNRTYGALLEIYGSNIVVDTPIQITNPYPGTIGMDMFNTFQGVRTYNQTAAGTNFGEAVAFSIV